MIIGITGKYCAGKNRVAAILEARGLPVIDADKLGHQALETEKETIFAQFGPDLKNADGSVNKRLLGKRTFGKPEKLASLEAIVHPVVNRLIEELIKTGTGTCVINAALLHKAAIFNRLDRIILVTAPLLTRLLRARRRDKLTWTEILRRFGSQKDFNSQYLAKKAEIYIVENPGLSGSRNPDKKPENRIDKFLEGIR
jgi:dephospho-CoA kinase